MTTRNPAASVRARLLNKARADGVDFQLLLTRYGLERLLYRLSVSRERDNFLLKGALLFDLWYDVPLRPTRDIDLLGFGLAEIPLLVAAFEGICAVEVDDGMAFDAGHGLAAWQLGVREAKTLSTYPLRGALFESWVVAEFVKRRLNVGMPADLYFWRDNVGHEVDVVVETAAGLQAIEIKSGASFIPEWLNVARKWTTFAGGEALLPRVAYGGDLSFERDGSMVCGWPDVAAALPH
jgi:hypothetical protein